MEIYRLPVLSDNYIFLLHDRTQDLAAVVDPAQAEPVLEKLQDLNAQLIAIFNTHHHADHIGGNGALKHAFPDLTIYGGRHDRGRIPGQSIFLDEGDRVSFAGREGHIYFVPGHTRAHIAYYFPPTHPHDPGDLFCGDTLFAGGCGRLFEGTPAQMLESLSKLRALPDATRIWCAHEYTLKNLQFALTVDSENPQLQQRFQDVKTARSHQQATVPSRLGLEKQTNPCLRWDHPPLQQIVQSRDHVQTFACLRGRKDLF